MDTALYKNLPFIRKFDLPENVQHQSVLLQVIYALNTKNDEHESIVAGLKEHHEDQQQQLMAEMKHKIEFYREQISKDAGYAAQIRALQEHIQSQTDEQKKALDEFALYRQQAEEREAILKADFSQKTLTFSQQVLKMKKDFEEKLQMIDSLRSEYDLDKANALESLRAEHRHELEQVHLSQVEQASDLSDVKRHLEEMYERDVTQLKQRLEEVEQSKRTLTEEYDAKMAKAKAFYEKELEAMKNSQDSDRQKEMQELEERFKKMKKSLELVEMTSQQRIDALLGQLSASEDEVNKYKSELDELRDSVKNKASETSKSNKEVGDVLDYKSVKMIMHLSLFLPLKSCVGEPCHGFFLTHLFFIAFQLFIHTYLSISSHDMIKSVSDFLYLQNKNLHL